MNYWIENLFKDGSFWTKILIPGIGFLLLIDVLSYILNRPGYFHLWPLRITAAAAVPLIIRIIYKNFHTLNRIKKVESEAPVFEKKREREILDIIAVDPDFTTFCYECIYFSDEKKSCSRDRVFERVKEIRAGQRTYCLYWEEKQMPSVPFRS